MNISGAVQTMWQFLRYVLSIALLAIGTSAVAQQDPPKNLEPRGYNLQRGDNKTAYTAMNLYLRRVDGKWTANLDGDLKDPDTEWIEVVVKDGAFDVRTKLIPGDGPLCMTKMRDRTAYGYSRCNSAFFSANIGSSAAGTLARGVLSLGILTVTDAVTGNTGFSVSFDKEALDAAVAESKAVELVQATYPLLEYRNFYKNAQTSEQLRHFIAKYDGVYDPESLVVNAKAHLPVVVEREQTSAKRNAEAEAALAIRQAEYRRQQDLVKQAELEVLRQFRSKLSPGDQVKVVGTHFTAYGMVIEIRKPLAQVQWDNVDRAIQWMRIEDLLPIR